MTIWNIDDKILDFLRPRQGMPLAEIDITGPLKISHGTFSAVRKRLLDAGALSCSRVGRKLMFRVLAAPKADVPDGGPPPSAVPPTPSAVPSSSAAPDIDSGQPLEEAAPSPHIIGWYPSVDDWLGVLMQRLGDVAADQVDDETYTVTIMATMEEQLYTVRDVAGGVEISEAGGG